MSDKPEQAIVSEHENGCKSAISAFKRELQKVRTGRASGSLLEGVMVDYYGSKTALSHLGQITAPEARLILIQVYDSGAVSAVEKAIQSAGLGFNPSREGNTIRIMVPPLTEESRKELVRVLHKMAEDIRVSIRNHRRDALDKVKKLEKDSVLTKDDSKRAQDRIQKLVDTYIDEVDKMLKAKEAECMEV